MNTSTRNNLERKVPPVDTAYVAQLINACLDPSKKREITPLIGGAPIVAALFRTRARVKYLCLSLAVGDDIWIKEISEPEHKQIAVKTVAGMESFITFEPTRRKLSITEVAFKAGGI